MDVNCSCKIPSSIKILFYKLYIVFKSVYGIINIWETYDKKLGIVMANKKIWNLIGWEDQSIGNAIFHGILTEGEFL